MIPDGRDCTNAKCNGAPNSTNTDATMSLNNNSVKLDKNTNCGVGTEMNNQSIDNKENSQNASNTDEKKKNSLIETEVANEISTEMNRDNKQKAKKSPMVYKLVLTGGPCSGKTTGQARLATFFENLGWKVFRVPETATILFNGGIRFSDMSREEGKSFVIKNN